MLAADMAAGKDGAWRVRQHTHPSFAREKVDDRETAEDVDGRLFANT